MATSLLSLIGVGLALPKTLKGWGYEWLIPTVSVILVALLIGSGLLHASGDRRAASASRKIMFAVFTGLATVSAVIIITAIVIALIIAFFVMTCMGLAQGH